jgi:hypothetical protein
MINLVAHLLLFGAVAKAPAEQPRWQEIGTTGTGNSVYVDRRSVRTAKDGIITATVRALYAKPVTIPGQKRSLTATRAIAMFNCASKTFAVKESWLLFDEKTNAAYQHKVNKIPGYGPTIAGSYGDVALKHFCPGKP